MTTRAATKADLHDLVDELPERSVDTAKRFLESLRSAASPTNFIARFIETMDADEAALLDGLAELDRDHGPPTLAADEPDSPR